MTDLRMVAVVPRSLRMSAGKVASQAGHVFAELAARCAVDHPRVWESYAQAPVKLVLQVRDDAALFEVARNAARKKLPRFVFMDSGPTTQGTGNQVTAVGIGPVEARRLVGVTRHLDLY